MEPQNDFIKHSYAELLRFRDRIDQSSFQVIIKNLSEMEAHPEAAALEADAFVYDGMKKAQLEKKQVMPKEKSQSEVRGIAIFQLVMAAAFSFNILVTTISGFKADSSDVPQTFLGFALGLIRTVSAYNCCLENLIFNSTLVRMVKLLTWGSIFLQS